MRKFALTAIVVASLAGNALAADVQLKTEDEKTVYAMGLMFSQSLAGYNLSPAELDIFKAGLTEGFGGKESKKVDLEAYRGKIQQFAQSRQEAQAAIEKKAGDAYLAKAATEPGAKKTESGLIYFETKAGTGESPKATDKVKVHYHGTLIDGTVFDSSVQRGEPATFPLNQVIKCWTEGVQLMKVGGKAKLVCPADIAYGNRGAGKIKAGSTLIFEVELIEIVK